MTGVIDNWLQIGELAKLFGLSEESMKRLAAMAFHCAA
jgi:hypothetical protein